MIGLFRTQIGTVWSNQLRERVSQGWPAEKQAKPNRAYYRHFLGFFLAIKYRLFGIYVQVRQEGCWAKT